MLYYNHINMQVYVKRDGPIDVLTITQNDKVKHRQETSQDSTLREETELNYY